MSDKKDHRTNAHTVRYNDDENELITLAAKEASLEVASWIRMVSMRAARPEEPSDHAFYRRRPRK